MRLAEAERVVLDAADVHAGRGVVHPGAKVPADDTAAQLKKKFRRMQNIIRETKTTQRPEPTSL